MRGHRIALMLILLVTLAACRPGVPLGSPESVFTHADGYAAVDMAFAPYGPGIVACAHGIVTNESGHWPYASRNRPYQGEWQMHPGFSGSYQRAVDELGGGRFASAFDPYVQSMAARYAFEAAGGSFRANWAGTTPAGCP